MDKTSLPLEQVIQEIAAFLALNVSGDIHLLVRHGQIRKASIGRDILPTDVT